MHVTRPVVAGDVHDQYPLATTATYQGMRQSSTWSNYSVPRTSFTCLFFFLPFSVRYSSPSSARTGAKPNRDVRDGTEE